MPLWLTLVLLGAITLLNYRMYYSILYPPFIFSAMWLLDLSIYSAGLIEVNAIHSLLLVLIVLGNVAFSVGGMMARLVPQPMVDRRFRFADFLGSPRPFHFTKMVLLFLAFVGMLFSAYTTISHGMQGVSESFLANAREATVSNSTMGGGSFAFAAYIPIWSTLAATLFMIERRDWAFWAMAVIAFVSAVLTTGRTPILELFVMLTVVLLSQANKVRFLQALKFARVPIVIFVALYILLAFTNKNTAGIEGGVVGVILYFVVGYIVGPLAAMDYVLQHPREYLNAANHTFKFPLEIGSALHLWQYTPPPLFDQFQWVPFPTNVYTGFKFYFTDFGFFGCLLAVGIIGLLQTLLYRKSQTGSAVGLYLYAFSAFPLVMFIFDDIYSATGEVANALLFLAIYMTVRPLRFLPQDAIPRWTRMPRLGLSWGPKASYADTTEGDAVDGERP